jgi:hypothetical protein
MGPVTDAPATGDGLKPVAEIDGIPVYLDGAIPAGTSADTPICCRPSDMMLWESTEKFRVMASPLSGTLQIRLSYHRYVAFLPHRYPTGTGFVSSIAVPTAF